MSNGAVLFEFVQIGQQMRVAAIDEASGVEVVVITPLNASRNDMQRLALAKLQRKLGSEQSPPPQPRGKYA
ncbi:DUF6898 family protein [Devosia faecipullorum]|uniref:DUF6898 family protein n=1 Tax=Devosia faecipullorum TaxID=2755039 RepID=UPI00187B5BCD|nr:serine hydroxymethyltransferase [Devosia faecipullorum]MBE7734455.1 serine hydroxymethyltransferase [Devosia faecipullorum]